MTADIWRLSGRLNIPLYPEFSKEETNDDWNLTSIKVMLKLRIILNEWINKKKNGFSFLKIWKIMAILKGVNSALTLSLVR